jgi:hypothetical protein
MGEFQCGHCGQTIAVADDHLGRNVQCPHCQQFVVAPDAAAAVPFVPEPAAAPAAVPAAAPRRRNPLAMLLLIFLVPYCVISTGVIVWLYLQQKRNDTHPLEWLLDQQPEDGGPKQIKHDLPLLDRQKTPLGQPIQVGTATEVTPLQVDLVPGAEVLVLTFRVKNLTADQRFNPVPRSFLRRQGYTFLQFGNDKWFGGILSYRRSRGFWADPRGRLPGAAAFDGVLDPGETMTATLSQTPAKEALRRLLDFRGPLLWRLEVRRGLVEVAGRQVSATAVVGVEFDVAPLLGEQREVAGRGGPVFPAFFSDYFALWSPLAAAPR